MSIHVPLFSQTYQKEIHGETSEPCIVALKISYDIAKQYDPTTIIQIAMEIWSQISACTYSLRKLFMEQQT